MYAYKNTFKYLLYTLYVVFYENNMNSLSINYNIFYLLVSYILTSYSNTKYFMIVYDVICMLTSFTMSLSYVFVRICIYIQDGSTALIYAAREGYTEIADLLVRSNADVNVKDTVRINTRYHIYTIDHYKRNYLELLRTNHVSMLCTGTISYLGSIMEKERRVVLINDLYAIR